VITNSSELKEANSYCRNYSMDSICFFDFVELHCDCRGCLVSGNMQIIEWLEKVLITLLLSTIGVVLVGNLENFLKLYR